MLHPSRKCLSELAEKYIAKQFEGGWGQKLILAVNCAVDFKYHFPQSFYFANVLTRLDQIHSQAGLCFWGGND